MSVPSSASSTGSAGQRPPRDRRRPGFDNHALTDHGAPYGAIAFHQAANAKGFLFCDLAPYHLGPPTVTMASATWPNGRPFARSSIAMGWRRHWLVGLNDRSHSTS